MSYKPQRTFNGIEGEPSRGTMGPLQISHDIDELCKMFDTDATHDGGQPGGISVDNLRLSGLDVNQIGGIASSNIKAIRERNNVLEYSTDGTTYKTTASSATPKMDGTASAGTASTFSRGDHVHPSDTSKQEKINVNGLLKGNGAGEVTAAIPGTDYLIPGNYMVRGIDYVTAGKKDGTTLGTFATAEGQNTTASGYYSHAEGDRTTARGDGSHAEGVGTLANHLAQHVFGSYNVADPSQANAGSQGNYVEIVGNGRNDSDRSNARTLDWNGNETLAGKLTLGSAPTANMDAATKQYVDVAIAGVDTLPSQSGHSGEFLTTNGTAASWSDDPMKKGVDYVTAGKKSGTTLGSKATAEGVDTTASAIGSHAEGRATIASDYYAHAEGEVTTASGQRSHAEGLNTTASGNNAHAEGTQTTASGDSSHAEGVLTQANGNFSHAEGDRTTANGIYSHAEGSGTTATRKSQHVFGEYNIADSSGADTRGNYVEIVGKGASENTRSNARTLDWDGNEVLAGKLTVGAGPTNNMDVATKTYVDAAVAGASGAVDSVNGQTGVVVLDASDVGAQPSLPSQSGNSGKFLTTDGTDVSWSDKPMVKGVDYVTAGRLENSAVGRGSTAEGLGTTASDYASHAEGGMTTASASCSHAEGANTTASGADSHAEGSQTTASGERSHAEGYQTIASGKRSHAEGYQTTASGSSSHAEGYQTTASGGDSHTEGTVTTASGYNSHAEGNNATASGDESHAEGWGTIANSAEQHVFGAFNIPDSNMDPEEWGTYIEIVGNGTSANRRSNARTLDWNGNEILAGKLTVGIAPTNDMDAATKKYVDDAVAGGGGGAVNSVNGKTGVVVLDAEDVGALPDDTAIPTKVSDLTNDSGFITTETDPTVPSWAKAASKPKTSYFGTSNTTISTSTKSVTCSGFVYEDGLIIAVHFLTGNTGAPLSLNVNNTGAKPVYVGLNQTSSTTNVLCWSAGTMVYFVCFQNAYLYVTSVSPGNVPPSRGAATWIGTCSTAAATATKSCVIENYFLTIGSLVSINFSTANSVDEPSLTVTSTGAKRITYNGALTSSTNPLLWKAGETLTFIYTGSYYECISRTGYITADDALPNQTGHSGEFLTTNGTGASWVGLPSDVFVAIHGTTTYTEVLAAYYAGKFIYAINSNSDILPLAKYHSSGSSFYFRNWTANNGSALLILNSDNNWSSGSYTFANANTKINGYALSSNITLKTSDLTNDSGYLTLATLPIYDGTVI